MADRCLQIVADAAELTDDERQQVIAELEKLKGDPAMREKAIKQAEVWQQESALRLKQAQDTATIQKAYKQYYDKAVQSNAKAEPGKIQQAFLVGYQTMKKSAVFQGMRRSVYFIKRQEGVRARYQAYTDIVDKLGPAAFKLFSDKQFNELIMREMGGKATGNESAATMAKIMTDHLEQGRLALNDAGANVRKVDGYTHAQYHDQYLIAKALKKFGPNGWIDFIKPLLKPETFGDENPDVFLKTVQDNILQQTHEDWKPENTAYKGTAGLAKRLSRKRVLQFKDNDAFMQYNNRFGHGTPVQNMLHQIGQMHENAMLMKQMTVNPDQMLEFMVSHGQSEARARGVSYNSGEQQVVRHAYQALTNHNPVASWTLHHAFNLFRASLNAIHLGSAAIHSFGDSANMVANLRYNGMGVLESEAQALKNFTKFMTFTNGKLDKDSIRLATAARAGFDGFQHQAATRYDPMGDYTGIAAKMSNLEFKYNRQQGWDDLYKGGTGQALMSLYHSVRKLSWDKLGEKDEGLQRGLSLAGIDEAGWEKMRASPVQKIGDNEYLTPDAIEDKDVRNNYAAHLLSTAEDTVPLPGARQNMLMGKMGLQRGTWSGEMMNLFGLMYKSFPFSQMNKMWPKIAQMKAPGLTLMLPTYIMMGYASLAVGNLVEGREPPDPTDYKTYLESLAQSGGASMLADLFEHKFGQNYGIADFLAGPAAENLTKLITPASEAMHGQTPTASTGMDFLNSINPAANMWFTKAAYNYLVQNELMEALRPGYIQRTADREQQNYNVKYWLDPNAVHEALHK